MPFDKARESKLVAYRDGSHQRFIGSWIGHGPTTGWLFKASFRSLDCEFLVHRPVS